MTIDRLFVIWRAPGDGRRYVVGHLSRDRQSGRFRFWYESDLSEAQRHGFALLPAFALARPERDPYEARYLFATFADRIPSPQRADAAEILRSWAVEHSDDQFEILSKSGGLRATDRIEVSEYRAVDDQLAVPLEFRVAGSRHVAPECRAVLTQGAQLYFEREPGNQFDAAATVIATTSDGKRAGYVPRQYSALVAKLLDAGVALSGQALRELIIPEDAGRWLVRVSRDD